MTSPSPRSFTRSIIAAIAVFGGYPSRSHAQAVSPSVSWLRLSISAEQSAQLNTGESPYRYSGIGPGFLVGFGRDTKASAFDVSAGGGRSTLHSDITGGSADHGSALVVAGYVHDLPWSVGGMHWMIGAETSLRAEANVHHFSAPGLDDKFGFVNAALGPSLRVERRGMHATIANDLVVPLANWIDFPPTNTNTNPGGTGLRLKFASLPTLVSFDDALSYRVGSPSARNVAWAYHLSYLRYVLTDARRFARQSVTLTFNTPLRRSHP